jgi:hypothetical protein
MKARFVKDRMNMLFFRNADIATELIFENTSKDCLSADHSGRAA